MRPTTFQETINAWFKSTKKTVEIYLTIHLKNINLNYTPRAPLLNLGLPPI
jgi:hypothetical protein